MELIKKISKETKRSIILDGDLKRKVFLDIAKHYKGIKVVNSREGSNPFLVAASNRILPDYGYRIARLSEATGIPFGYCFDLSGVLREVQEEETYQETYHGRNLLDQIKIRESSPNFPIKIDWADTILAKDPKDIKFGCSFELKECPVIAYASSILNHKNNNFSDNDIDSETGLPNQLILKGNRRLFNEPNKPYQQDLTRLILTQNLSINSNFPNFTHSSPAGRILIIKND